VRIRVSGAPGGLRNVRFERGGNRPESAIGTHATWDGKSWSAVLDVNGTPDPEGYWFKGTLADGKAFWHRGDYALWPTASPMLASIEDWASFTIDAAHAYEPGIVMVRTEPIGGLPAGASGVRAACSIEPADMPLKKPVPLTLELPAGMSPDRVGICRRDGDGDSWDWEGADFDSSERAFKADVGRLGQFALVRDTQSPEVELLAAPPHVPAGPYPKWDLTARAVDRLSGIDGHNSFLSVDGSRVPTEWDPEGRVLRWRPRVAPAPGRHAVRVEVVDHAGNRTVKSGAFVLTSR
jgi:hypothetical protein